MYDFLSELSAINIDGFSIFISILLATMTIVLTVIQNKYYKKNTDNNEKIFEKIVIHKTNDAINKVSLTQNNAINANKASQQSEMQDEFSNEINELIKNHHLQALHQSKIQFRFSLIASIIGFLFIIVNVIICVFIMENMQWYNCLASTVPGAVFEGVSILFFSQSKETRERSSDFLNRLREDRHHEKSVIIANSIDDEKLRSIVKAEVALKLSGIDNINIFNDYK